MVLHSETKKYIFPFFRILYFKNGKFCDVLKNTILLLYTATALKEVGWLILFSAAFASWESPRYSFLGGWVDPRNSLDTKDWKKISTVSDTRDRTRAVQLIAKRLAAWATWPKVSELTLSYCSNVKKKFLPAKSVHGAQSITLHISTSPFAQKYWLQHSASSLLLYIFDPVRSILIGPIFTILANELIKTDKRHQNLSCNIRKEAPDMKYFHSRRVLFVLWSDCPYRVTSC